ncbi:hypothetical protein Tco_0079432 [Tanacetum coccineum]
MPCRRANNLTSLAVISDVYSGMSNLGSAPTSTDWSSPDMVKDTEGDWSIASAHRGVSIPGFAGLCLHATPPPDTKARTSSASLIPKCQKQYIATVAQVLKFSPSTKIQAIIPGANLYLNTNDREDSEVMTMASLGDVFQFHSPPFQGRISF